MRMYLVSICPGSIDRHSTSIHPSRLASVSAYSSKLFDHHRSRHCLYTSRTVRPATAALHVACALCVAYLSDSISLSTWRCMHGSSLGASWLIYRCLSLRQCLFPAAVPCRGGWWPIIYHNADRICRVQTPLTGFVQPTNERFYRAMHFSAKRGIAIACRLSVCLSVRPSVCDVGELWSHRLEFFNNNFTIS